MTSGSPQGTALNTNSSYDNSGPSQSAGPSATPTASVPRRLFHNLRRMSMQSLNSIQTALPEYSETSSIRSYRPESSSVTPSISSNPNRVSVTSRLPPRYSVAFGAPLNEYEFKIRVNNPWATLKVFALGSTTPSHKPRVPHLSCKDLVSGVVELRLDSSQTIQKITISVVGILAKGSFEEGRSTFLDHSVVIWAKERGDPRNITGTAGSAQKFDGKLQGSYNLPFSFPFPTPQTRTTPSSPTGVTPFDLLLNSPMSPTSEKHQGRTRSRFLNAADVPFPPTFQEHHVSVSVEYEITLQITLGRFKPDARIRAPFKYILTSSPPPMSESRRFGYEANVLIPGPIADPDGWVKLAPARIMGQMLPSEHVPPKSVSMMCTLYLATPLSYPRGSIIPCHLALQSEDENVLDVLATPKSSYLRLIWRLTYFSTYRELGMHTETDHTLFPHAIMILQEHDNLKAQTKTRVLNQNGSTGYVDETVKECAVATWWIPPKDVPQERTVRHLEGEIHLPKELHPSCPSNIFKIEYFVELLPPVALGFEPFSGIASLAPATGERGDVSKSDPRTEVLLSQPIDIVTLHAADDPLPIPFTEPRPRRDDRPQTASYGSATPRENEWLA